jgi:hypothetical protein
VDIPILTSFIEGLKLFFASKRLKWLTLIFFIGAFTITIWENLALMFPVLSVIALFVGGVFPTFFLITGFISLIGLARFVVDEESYTKSFVYTMIWIVVSLVTLVMLLIIRPFFNLMYIGVAFLGWIGFQSYFSTRSSLGYAEGVTIESKSKLVHALYGFLYLFNYVVIAGAAIFTYIFVNPFPGLNTALAIIGVLFAMFFNFVNGLILAAERNKPHASNISFLGVFISFYSAYFIYNVMKGYTPGLDLVNIGITVFFILYTMSSVGRTLASRAELDTRWKLSKELAATFTFFLASGFMFVDAMFSVILGASFTTVAGVVGDSVKLIVFPLVAFVMELNFLRKARKLKPVEQVTPEGIPETPEEPETETLDEEPEEVVEYEPEEFEEEEPAEEIISEEEPLDEEVDDEGSNYPDESSEDEKSEWE